MAPLGNLRPLDIVATEISRLNINESCLLQTLPLLLPSRWSVELTLVVSTEREVTN